MLEGDVMIMDKIGFASMRDVLGRRRNASGFNHNSMRTARVWHTHQEAHKEHEARKEVTVEKSQPLSDPVADFPKDGRVKRTLSEKKALEEVDRDAGKGLFTKTPSGNTSTNKEESTKTHAKASKNRTSEKTITLESNSNTKIPQKKDSDKSPSGKQKKR
ncbi:hypothetical protein G7Y79_00026g058510 [Physcia stellaris]|nr:hypothetical protein G7Y79_00026g058510 [Physcia stellaris]